MQRVAVIGAGVVGSSIAFRLAQAGAEVWLLDRAQPGGGTTGSSFAWANANQKTPRDYYELNYAGLREHYRLREELGEAPWFHPEGNLMWDEDPTELKQRVARLRDWDYAAEWRGAAEVSQELEPRLRFAAPETPVAFFPEEAWIEAPRLAAALIERGRAHGLTARFGDEVRAIERQGEQVAAVRLASGERIPVDAVVNAAGPGADRVAALLDLPLPLGPTRGLLVRLAAAGAPLGRIAHTPGVNLRPDGPGHLLIHHESIDHQLGERTGIALDDPLVAELRRRALAALDGLGEAPVVAARIGTRPLPVDGRSCLGAVSAAPGYYEAVTHSGVTLGPLLGRLLTGEILSGEVDPLAAPFRPDRFARQ
ncbi:MAG TPA: FAD-binding oxidoreductase [Thermomicrobiaceae bacterium]|nr:FAD-binding oxidoreductase [Thermomicrobiaceae bacterium]